MSSIHILNKGTLTKPGGGLPIYDNVDYVFSNTNSEVFGTDGLWPVPNNKVPTFQLWINFEFITSFVYHETRGGNDFTGTTFTPVANGGITIKGVQIDTGSGLNQTYIYAQNGDGSLLTPAPDGRWVAFLTVNNGGGETIFYSEEFVTKPCC